MISFVLKKSLTSLSFVARFGFLQSSDIKAICIAISEFICFHQSYKFVSHQINVFNVKKYAKKGYCFNSLLQWPKNMMKKFAGANFHFGSGSATLLIQSVQEVLSNCLSFITI